MRIASTKPIERYEAIRREHSLTVTEVISKVDPFTKEKIQHPLRNVVIFCVVIENKHIF